MIRISIFHHMLVIGHCHTDLIRLKTPNKGVGQKSQSILAQLVLKEFQCGIDFLMHIPG